MIMLLLIAVAGFAAHNLGGLDGVMLVMVYILLHITGIGGLANSMAYYHEENQKLQK
jgi:hypothetical protein